MTEKIWVTCPVCRRPHQISIEIVKEHQLEYLYYQKLIGIITSEVQLYDQNGCQFRTHIFNCDRCNDRLCIIDGCQQTEDACGLCRKHINLCGCCDVNIKGYQYCFCEKHRCHWIDTHPSSMDCGNSHVDGDLYCAEHLKLSQTTH